MRSSRRYPARIVARRGQDPTGVQQRRRRSQRIRWPSGSAGPVGCQQRVELKQSSALLRRYCPKAVIGHHRSRAQQPVATRATADPPTARALPVTTRSFCARSRYAGDADQATHAHLTADGTRMPRQHSPSSTTRPVGPKIANTCARLNDQIDRIDRQPSPVSGPHRYA